MKKKILIALVAGLTAFVASLVAAYYAMPSLAPSVVEAVQVSDSLARAKDTSATPALAKLVADLDLPDSLLRVKPDFLPRTSDSLGIALPVHRAIVKALEDSVIQVRRHVERVEQEKEALLAELESVRQQASVRKAQQVEIGSLSSTLSKLEERELSAILQQLDLAVLEQLYKQATGRNQARMLQAMPAEYAARFVRRLAGAPEVPSQDTLASEAAINSEPQ